MFDREVRPSNQLILGDDDPAEIGQPQTKPTRKELYRTKKIIITIDEIEIVIVYQTITTAITTVRIGRNILLGYTFTIVDKSVLSIDPFMFAA